jgi:hypothetical protein
VIHYPAVLPGLGLAAFTHHALDRYRERVRPHLDSRKAAYEDARRLIEVCAVVDSAPPDWMNGHYDGRSTMFDNPQRRYVACGDVCFIIDPSQGDARWAILTTVCRGGISEAAREHRNRQAAGRRRGRRYKQGNRTKTANRRRDRDARAPEE